MLNRKLWNRSRLAITLATAGVPLCLIPNTSATTRTYSITLSGDWNTANNWSPTGVPVGGANGTTPGDTVNITSFGNGSLHTVTFDVNNYAASSPIGPLTIDLTGGVGSTDTLLQTANTLSVYGGDSVGLSGSGTFNQTGGIHIIGISSGTALGVGVNSGSNGFYYLGNNTGGNPTLTVNAVEVEGISGTGSFTQFSGTHTLNGSAGVSYVGLNTGSVGNFTMNGGSFTANGGDGQSICACVGYSGTGTFTQNGGNVVSANGGGYLVIGEKAGGVGSYTMNNVNSPSLSVSGAEIIADYATGTTTAGVVTQYGGSFTQAAGNHSVSNYLIVANMPGSTGAYTLTNGTLSTYPTSSAGTIAEAIGGGGIGFFNQSGGTNNVGSHSNQVLDIGYQSGGTGTYLLNNTNAMLQVAGSELLGDAATGSRDGSGNVTQYGGTFNQTAGTHIINADLSIGNNPGSSGAFYLSGGSLADGANTPANTIQTTIGDGGTGLFVQTGGTHTVGTASSFQGIIVGEAAGILGTYVLNGSTSASTLTDYGSELIGVASTGTTVGGVITRYGGWFNQGTGSTHIVTGSLTLGNNANGTGLFTLSGGTLATATTLVTVGASQPTSPNDYIGYRGVGTFNQTGGTHTFTASIAFYGAGGAVPGSLIIGETSAALGSYSLSGTGTLTGYGDEVIADSATGSGGIPGGRFSQSIGTTNYLGGAVDIGQSAGGVGVYTMSGGTLMAGAANIGNAGNGTFNQTAGNASFLVGPGGLQVGYVQYDALFEIGDTASGNGTYNISGTGTLTLYSGNSGGFATIGEGGTGTLNQFSTTSSVTVTGSFDIGSYTQYFSGGAVVTNYGTGTYNLSSGTLTAAGETVGSAGTGHFIQSGGTNTINGGGAFGAALTVAGSNSSFGTYVLSGTGQLIIIGDEIISYEGNGTSSAPNGIFTQLAGTNHTVTGTLYLGQQDPYAGVVPTGMFLRGIGQYNLSGGNLSSGGLNLGFAGTGIFNQTGGSYIVGTVGSPGTVEIGQLTDGLGSYTLNAASGASTLTVNGNEIVGDAATGALTSGGPTSQSGGTFNQSGGTQTITGTLIVGNSGTGLFTLSGGSLIVGSTETVGASGNGVFIESGSGSQTLGSSLSNQNLQVAANLVAAGNYSMISSSASLTVNGSAYIGGSNTSSGGTGTFNLSAGSVTVTNTLKVWNSSGSAVNLTGGILNLTTLDLTGNLSHFNWTGGDLNFLTAASVDSNFVLGSTVTLSGNTILSSNISLTDNGAIVLAGGSVGGAGSIINNALLTGFGSIIGSGGFTNNAELSQGSGNLLLTNTGININAGNIDLSGGRSLIIQGTSLNNSTGTINLNGATISGSGILLNANGGTVAGRGTIAATLINSTGATLIAQGGSLNVPAFNNSGTTQVTPGATLSGGLITNTAQIQGGGTINNSITNTGTIEAVGGVLALQGALTNGGAGIVRVDAGSTTSATGFPVNAAAISLNGGVLDTVGRVMTNSGTVLGYGDFRTGGLTNTGTITFAGGSATLEGPLTNNSNVVVQNTPALFTGLVINNGSFRVISGATATFAGGYNGSSPSPSAVVNTGTFSDSSGLISTGNFTNSGTLTISGTQNWLGGTTFTNTTGSATFSTDAGSVGSNLAVFVTGGTVTFGSVQHLAGLNISSGAQAQVVGGGSAGQRSLLYTPALTVNGILDLTGNDLDVQAGGSAGLSAVFNLVKQGFAGGSWTGNGINSSTAAGDNSHLTAVGVILNTGTISSLDGFAVASNDVLAKFTYYGDTNLDGKVDGSDYSRIDSAYLADRLNPNSVTGWFNGDFNYDGAINGSDYTLIDNAFNRQGASLDDEIAQATSQVAGGASVPEPAALAILGIGAVGLLSRRRKMM